MGAFHAVALNFQQKGARRSPILGEVNHVLDILLRQQRQARGDTADDRYASGIAVHTLPRRRRNGERSRLETFLLKVPLPLEGRDVVLDGCGIDSKLTTDLTNRRRKTVFLHVLVDEIEDGFLSFGKHE